MDSKPKRVKTAALFLLLASLGTAQKKSEDQPVLMQAEDGKTYQVKPAETLRAAMGRAAVASRGASGPAARQATPPPENGNCVPEGMEKKPEGSVGCKCYEVTECKGGEATQCKRHCKKDLCMCCSI